MAKMPKVSLSFSEISDRMRTAALPEVDVVVGIARGGIVPATMLAHQLACPLHLLWINYRDDANQPRYGAPKQLAGNLPDLSSYQQVLLVDDVSVSGKTLALARRLLNHPKVHTFTLKGTADCVLFPEIAACVNWPWKPIPTEKVV